MSSKLLASILVASGLLAGGSAFAAPWSWTGTLSSWSGSPVTDGDGDMLFTLAGFTLPATTPILISELEVGTADFYSVKADFGAGAIVNGTMSYQMDVLGVGEKILNVQMDSDVTLPGTGDTTTVVKDVLDQAGNPLSLASTDGGHAAGTLSNGGTSLLVTDTFSSTGNGVFVSATNAFTVGAVPEPTSLPLLGIGLAGLLLSRRRRAA